MLSFLFPPSPGEQLLAAAANAPLLYVAHDQQKLPSTFTLKSGHSIQLGAALATEGRCAIGYVHVAARPDSDRNGKPNDDVITPPPFKFDKERAVLQIRADQCESDSCSLWRLLLSAASHANLSGVAFSRALCDGADARQLALCVAHGTWRDAAHVLASVSPDRLRVFDGLCVELVCAMVAADDCRAALPLLDVALRQPDAALRVVSALCDACGVRFWRNSGATDALDGVLALADNNDNLQLSLCSSLFGVMPADDRFDERVVALLFDLTSCGTRLEHVRELSRAAPAVAVLHWLLWRDREAPTLPSLTTSSFDAMCALWSAQKLDKSAFAAVVAKFALRDIVALVPSGSFRDEFRAAACKLRVPLSRADRLSIDVLFGAADRVANADTFLATASDTEHWQRQLRLLNAARDLLDVTKPAAGGGSNDTGRMSLADWVARVSSVDWPGYRRRHLIEPASGEFERVVAMLERAHAVAPAARIARELAQWRALLADVSKCDDHEALCQMAALASRLCTAAAQCAAFNDDDALQLFWPDAAVSAGDVGETGQWWSALLAAYERRIAREFERIAAQRGGDVLLHEALDGSLRHRIESLLRLHSADEAERLHTQLCRAKVAGGVLLAAVVLSLGRRREQLSEAVRAVADGLRIDFANGASRDEAESANAVADATQRWVDDLIRSTSRVPLTVLDPLLVDADLCDAVVDGSVRTDRCEHARWLAHLLLRPALCRAVEQQMERHGDLTQRLALMAGSERLSVAKMRQLSALVNVANVLQQRAVGADALLRTALRFCDRAAAAAATLAALRTEQVAGLVADINAVGEFDQKADLSRDRQRAAYASVMQRLCDETQARGVWFCASFDASVATQLIVDRSLTYEEFLSIDSEARLAHVGVGGAAGDDTVNVMKSLRLLHESLCELLHTAAFGTAANDLVPFRAEFDGSQLARVAERACMYAQVWRETRRSQSELDRELLSISPQQLALAAALVPWSLTPGSPQALQLAAVLACRDGLTQIAGVAAPNAFVRGDNWLRAVLLGAVTLDASVLRADLQQMLRAVARLLRDNFVSAKPAPIEPPPLHGVTFTGAAAALVWLVAIENDNADSPPDRLRAYAVACALLSRSMSMLSIVDGARVLWCGNECGEVYDDEFGALTRFVASAARASVDDANTRLVVFPSRLSTAGVDALTSALVPLASASASASAAASSSPSPPPRLVLLFWDSGASRRNEAAGSAFQRCRVALAGTAASVSVCGVTAFEVMCRHLTQHMVRSVNQLTVNVYRMPIWRYACGKSTAVAAAMQSAGVPVRTVPFLPSTEIDELRARLRYVVSEHICLQIDAADAAQGARIDAVLFDLLVLGRVTGSHKQVPASLLHGTTVHIELADGAERFVPLTRMLLDAVAGDAVPPCDGIDDRPRIGPALLERAERAVPSTSASERRTRECLLLRGFVGARDEPHFDVLKLTRWLTVGVGAMPFDALVFRSAAPSGELVSLARGPASRDVLRDTVRLHVCGDEARWRALVCTDGDLSAFCMSSSICVRLILLHALRSLACPVVLLGETGCSKTALIRAYALLRGEALSVLDVHPAVRELDVVRFVDSAKTPLVFIDEVNSAHVAALVKCAAVDRRVVGAHTSGDAALAPGTTVMAACNPTRAEGGQAAYAVFPLPATLRHFVVDCVALTADVDDFMEVCEERMAARVAEHKARALLVALVREAHQFVGAFVRRSAHGADGAIAASNFNAPPSLREIDRVLVLVEHFERVLQLSSASPSMTDVERWLTCASGRGACLLAVLDVYFFRLPDAERHDLASRLSVVCESDVDVNAVVRCVRATVARDFPLQAQRNVIASDALLENLHLLYSHVLNRLPIMLVGESGTSKSLSAALLVRLVNERRRESDEDDDGDSGARARMTLRLRDDDEPTIVAPVIQCSHELSSRALEQQFASWTAYGSGRISNELVMLVLEEVAAAENLSDVSALKVLPALLDRNAARPERERVALVALSNAYLDAAKMNRATVVHRDVLGVGHAHDVVRKVLAAMPGGAWDAKFVDAVAGAIARAYRATTAAEPHFGMRDLFAALVDTRARVPRTKALLVNELAHAFVRHFGGAHHRALHEFLAPELDTLDGVELDLEALQTVAAPLRVLGEQLARAPSRARRHVLLVSERQLTFTQILLVARQCAKRDDIAAIGPRPYFGAVGDGGIERDELATLVDALRDGKMLFVYGGRSDLYAALHDVFSAHDVASADEQRHARVAVGDSSRVLPEGRTFAAVLSVTHAELAKLPHSLANRLHKLELSDEILLEMCGRGVRREPKATQRSIVDELSVVASIVAWPFDDEAAIEAQFAALDVRHASVGDALATLSTGCNKVAVHVIGRDTASPVAVDIDAARADVALTSYITLRARLRAAASATVFISVPLDVAAYSDDALRLRAARSPPAARFEPALLAVALMDEISMILANADGCVPARVVILLPSAASEARTPFVRVPSWHQLVVVGADAAPLAPTAARAIPFVSPAAESLAPLTVAVESQPVPRHLSSLLLRSALEEVALELGGARNVLIGELRLALVDNERRRVCASALVVDAARVQRAISRSDKRWQWAVTVSSAQWQAVANSVELLCALVDELPSQMRDRVRKRYIGNAAPTGVFGFVDEHLLCFLKETRHALVGVTELSAVAFSQANIEVLNKLVEMALLQFERVEALLDTPHDSSLMQRLFVADEVLANAVQQRVAPHACTLRVVDNRWCVEGARRDVTVVHKAFAKRMRDAQRALIFTALCDVNVARAMARNLLRSSPSGELEVVTEHDDCRLVQCALLALTCDSVSNEAELDDVEWQTALSQLVGGDLGAKALQYNAFNAVSSREAMQVRRGAHEVDAVSRRAVLLLHGQRAALRSLVGTWRVAMTVQQLAVDTTLKELASELIDALAELDVAVVDFVASDRVLLASPDTADNLQRARKLLLEAQLSSSGAVGTVPAEWTAGDRCAVLLPAGCAEYERVAARIRRDGFQCMIVSIERVQVKEYWLRYDAQVRSVMQSLGRSRDAVERWLIHGTRGRSPHDIVVHGNSFHTAYANRAGLLGGGIYFAENAAYSDRDFAFTTHNGKQLTVALVLTGEIDDTTRGQNHHPKAGCHSVRGQGFADMPAYVVYDNHVAYATHIVTYR